MLLIYKYKNKEVYIMKNTEKQDYPKDILKKMENKNDDLAISTLKTHLAHWVNQYFHFLKRFQIP